MKKRQTKSRSSPSYQSDFERLSPKAPFYNRASETSKQDIDQDKQTSFFSKDQHTPFFTPTKSQPSPTSIQTRFANYRKKDPIGLKSDLHGSVQSQIGNKVHQSAPLIQRRTITAGETRGVADGTGPIFDSRIPLGNKFRIDVNSDSADWEAAIAAYINAIRPVGNVVRRNEFLDKNLTFQNNLPSATTWGQKRRAFVPDAKRELQMADQSEAIEKDRNYWAHFGTTAGKRDNRSTMINNAAIGLIDPFLIHIEVTPTVAGARPWKFLTQFSDSGRGYVIKIFHGTQNIEANIEDNRAFRGGAARPGTSTQAVGGNSAGYLYSSTHDQEDESFQDRINNVQGSNPATDTKGQFGRGFDALTWLAAEGARFNAVEQLGGMGSPESRFFIKPNDNWNGSKYLTTIQLMQNWKVWFDFQYDITNAQLAAVVSREGTDQNAPPPGAHYNLTRGKVLAVV